MAKHPIKTFLIRLRFHFISFIKPWRGLFHSPIVIYSMGKVGSTTIQHTLESLSLPNPIFHIHFLDWDYLNEVDVWRKSLGLGTAGHVIAGKNLRFFADRTWGKVRWKIITLVREPVGREVSDLFENLHTFPQLRELSSEALVDAAIAHMQAEMTTFAETDDYASSWFDRELKKVFDFDIYAADFDPQQGYAIYTSKFADILLIRLESLSSHGTSALQDFLGLEKVALVNGNVGAEKAYQPIYRAVKDQLKLEPAILNKIYSSRYASYFYTDSERSVYKKRWSRHV